MPHRQWDYNRTMLSKHVVHVRIPPLLDAIVYLSLLVMALLAVRGIDTLSLQLIFLGLGAAFGLMYRFVFRIRRYEKKPGIYFGGQLVIVALMLMVGSKSIDATDYLTE